MNDNIKELKDLEREMAAADTEKGEKADENCGPSMGWVPGLVLIGLGAFFLLTNFTGFRLQNWWALFILIPAFGSLGNFLRAYQKDDRLSHEARGSLVGAMLFFTLAATFLFGLSWSMIWPVFLIIGGLGALMAGLAGR